MKHLYVFALGAILFLGTGCAHQRCCGPQGGCAGGDCGVATAQCCHGTRDICQHCKSCGTQGCLPDIASWFRSLRWCGGCFGGWGCGERYYGDWYSDPHASCEPCDNHGNWTGPLSANYQPGQEIIETGHQELAPGETIIEQPTPATAKAGYGRSTGITSRPVTPLFPWLRTARYGMPQNYR